MVVVKASDELMWTPAVRKTRRADSDGACLKVGGGEEGNTVVGLP